MVGGGGWRRMEDEGGKSRSGVLLKLTVYVRTTIYEAGRDGMTIVRDLLTHMFCVI